MRFAVYVRVSTKDQNTQGQADELRAYLAGRSIPDVKWFVDHQTGTNWARPEFQKLQAGITRGEFHTVIVWKLDRLGRNMVEGMNVLARWAELGVRVVSVTQSIDLSGTLGRMCAAILLGFAELENQYRRERQRAGIEAAKRRGVYKGRRKETYKAKPKRALQLRQKGFRLGEIANALGVSEASVSRYCGPAWTNAPVVPSEAPQIGPEGNQTQTGTIEADQPSQGGQ